MKNINTLQMAQLLCASVTDVITTMTGFDVEIEPDCSSPIKLDQSGRRVTGAMAIFGSIDGIISLTTDVDSSKIIVAYMTGITPASLTEADIHDGMAELVNMLVGRIKADLIKQELDITITSPFSILGEDVDIVFKDKENRICRQFIAGDVEMVLELVSI